jgi:hypothetical protein
VYRCVADELLISIQITVVQAIKTDYQKGRPFVLVPHKVAVNSVICATVG